MRSRHLRIKVCEAPVLAMPNVQKPFEIKTDASAHALGAVLWQDGRVVAYHSEMFNTAVLNYPTYEKEMYTRVLAVKDWRHYLLGKETLYE